MSRSVKKDWSCLAISADEILRSMCFYTWFFYKKGGGAGGDWVVPELPAYNARHFVLKKSWRRLPSIHSPRPLTALPLHASVVEVSSWAHSFQDHVLNGSLGMVLPALRNTSSANVLLNHLGGMSCSLQPCRVGKASFLLRQRWSPFSVRPTLHWGLCTGAQRVCASPWAARVL